MPTLTITAKGQITLRKNLLHYLGVRPGDKISVDMLPGGRIEMKASQAAGKISDVFDFLKHAGGPALSIEEINRLAADGWSGKR